MDLVDEDDRARPLLQFADHRLEALLEIAAVLGAGNQAAEVEAVDHRVLEQIRDPAFDDQPRQAFGDRGLADAGFTDEQRVVLAATAQRLHHALDFEVAADQRVDAAHRRTLVEVDRVLLQRALVAALLSTFLAGFLFGRLFRRRTVLGDAVRDEVDDVEPRHALLTQQVDRVGVLFGEDRDQHVQRRDLLLAGRLHVIDRTLQHALERQRRLHLVLLDVFDRLDVRADVVAQRRLELVGIGAAGRQRLGDVRVGQERQQQVLDGQQLVTFHARRHECGVQGLLQLFAKHQRPLRASAVPQWLTDL